MPPALDTPHRSRRYFDLVTQLGEEADFRYGWRTLAAGRLGIAPSYLTRIFDGDGKRPVGMAVISRACDRLELDKRFFDASAGHYSAFPEKRSILYPRERTVEPRWYDEAHNLKLTVELLLARAARGDDFKIEPPAVEEVAARLLALPVLSTAVRVTSADESDAARVARDEGEAFLRGVDRLLLFLLVGERLGVDDPAMRERTDELVRPTVKSGA